MNASERQKEIIRHALGLGRRDSIYRNHYVAYGPENDDWQLLLEMVGLGLLAQRPDSLSSGTVFQVTDIGREIVMPNAKITCR